MTENDLLLQIIDLAHIYGWQVVHFRPALTSKGWRTPVQADGKGFPDLIMLNGKEMIVAEVKSDKGKVSLEQDTWLDAFREVGAETFVWRPKDWEAIQERLTK